MSGDESLPRKLTAILYADVAGYSRLTGADEEGTHRLLSQYLDIIENQITKHNGRVVHYAGDAVLADFSTITSALKCAWDAQSELNARNADLPDSRKVEFRIGVNLGEVIVDRDDIYGDGVNVAARLESLAEPGGICVSEAVRTAVGSKLPFGFEFMGEREVKNIAEPVRTYRIALLDKKANGPIACPYPGMVPFQANNAKYFYGRDEEIERMVHLLRHQRFMMVIGPSGSGKSSLIYAGLLPDLENNRYFDKDYWLIRTMRPGQQPMRNLAEVIGTDWSAAEIDPESVSKLLSTHPPAERLLLLVDQFEEVFTQVDKAERSRFIAALQAFRVPGNCALVLTVRADFYPDLMNSYLWPVDASQRIEVAPLRGDALRAAIERPATDVGVRVEPALVTQLLADAADEPGALPLLQETMRLLWPDLERRTLPYHAYERLRKGAGKDDRSSGLAVAIAMKADATLTELTPEQQSIARRIFLRLIQFGEGRADTRRQQTVGALRSVHDQDGQFESTLEHLTLNRLLTRSGGDENNPPAVDISHESLISSWSRLQQWADTRREAEIIRRRLEDKSAEWVRLGSASGGLLDEAELPEAERWLASDDAIELGYERPLEELVSSSRQAIDTAEKQRETVLTQQLEQAQALADEQTRSTRRMRKSAMALAALFCAAVAAAVYAWQQSRQAEQLAIAETTARMEAQRARIASAAQLLMMQVPQHQNALQDERAALMARQAFIFSQDANTDLKITADATLRRSLRKPGFSNILRPQAEAIAVSRDGTLLASASFDDNPPEVQIHELNQPRKKPRQLQGFPGARLPDSPRVEQRVWALGFSADGNQLYAGNADGSIGRWNLEHSSAPYVELPRLPGGIWSVAFSDDGQYAAWGGKQDNSFTLWDPRQNDYEPQTYSNPDPVDPGSGPPLAQEGGVPLAFSGDSKFIATGGLNGKIYLWHADNPVRPILQLEGHAEGLYGLTFYDDDKRLVSAGRDKTIRLWNLEDPLAEPLELSNGLTPAISIAVDEKYRLLASSSAGDGIRIWPLDAPTSAPDHIAAGYVYDIEFSPNTGVLASGGGGFFYLRLWDMKPGGLPVVLQAHTAGVCSVSFSPDGNTLLSGGGTGDGRVLQWDWLNLAKPPVILGSHEGAVCTISYSKDSTMALSSSWNGNSIKLWRLDRTPVAVESLEVMDGCEPWAARFSPDEQYVMATCGGGLYRWPMAQLQQQPEKILTLDNWGTEFDYKFGASQVAVASFSPAIQLQDLDSPQSNPVKIGGHTELGVWSLDYNSSGDTLATGSRDGVINLLMDAQPDTLKYLGTHKDAITRLRFSPDDKLLASVSIDHQLFVWDMQTKSSAPIVLEGHADKIYGLSYSPDGHYLVSASGDKTLLVWDLKNPVNSLSSQGIADLVCDKVTRNLTLSEWRESVGIDLPYQRTCPELPIHPTVTEEENGKVAR